MNTSDSVEVENKVSVVVLTKNSASTIERCLDSVFSQSRLPDEVVVIDGSSRDDTKSLLGKYDIRLIVEPGLGFGSARNLGVINSSGNIVFFLDSDCYAEHLWIENALRNFRRSEIVAVTGPTLLWNKDSTVARFLAFVRDRVKISMESRLVEIAPTMNLALRREVFEEVGLFDASLVRGEDTDLTYRISRSRSILWDPTVRIWFKGSPNFRIASRKCVDHFIGVGQLFAKHGFRKIFMSSFLPLRGILLVITLCSAVTGFWSLALGAGLILLGDLIYKMARMTLKYRDRCVVYYFAFFTWWSLASLAVFWGFARGVSKAYK
jgi:mycofactocin glycosyltransferase